MMQIVADSFKLNKNDFDIRRARAKDTEWIGPIYVASWSDGVITFSSRLQKQAHEVQKVTAR